MINQQIHTRPKRKRKKRRKGKGKKTYYQKLSQ